LKGSVTISMIVLAVPASRDEHGATGPPCTFGKKRGCGHRRGRRSGNRAGDCRAPRPASGLLQRCSRPRTEQGQSSSSELKTSRPHFQTLGRWTGKGRGNVFTSLADGFSRRRRGSWQGVPAGKSDPARFHCGASRSRRSASAGDGRPTIARGGGERKAVRDSCHTGDSRKMGLNRGHRPTTVRKTIRAKQFHRRAHCPTSRLQHGPASAAGRGRSSRAARPQRVAVRLRGELPRPRAKDQVDRQAGAHPLRGAVVDQWPLRLPRFFSREHGQEV